ncbi:hypothetical protein Tco_1493368 [Tanacetum coccineum]
MSNSNTNLQTQSSNALHNAIMEAGSKDRPPMLAPGNYVQWKSRIKRYIDTKPNSELIHYCLQNLPYTYQWAEKTVPVAEGSSETTTERYMENYKNVSQDIRDQLNAKAEAVQIILTGIDNDIYSTVDACQKSVSCYKSSSECPVLTSTTTRMAKNEVNEIRAERLARTANPLALVAQQQPVYHHQNHPTQNTQYSSTRSQQSTRNRGKAIVTSSAPTYDPEPDTIQEVTPDQVDNSGPIFDDEPMHKDDQDETDDLDQERDLLASLIQKLKCEIDDSKNRNKFLESSNKELVDKLKDLKKFKRNLLQYNEVELCVKGGKLIQPEFLKKAQRANPLLYDIGCYNDNLALMLAPATDETILEYALCFVRSTNGQKSKPPEQTLFSKTSKRGILLLIGFSNESSGWGFDQDETDDLDQERDLLASLIQKLKCEIDDSKNRNKFLESSNKELVDKLKDLKKFQAELDKYNDVNYASKVEIDCAKAKGDLIAQDDQDETDDLDQERDLLASLIQKLKCEIDDSKNRNKFLESSNKELVDKLKGEIEDFKTKYKSLESSNNLSREGTNELSTD